MSWKAEYALLILLSTVVDYQVGLSMAKSSSKRIRKRLLMVSLFMNLGILFLFKYFNFFSESVQVIFSKLSLFNDAPVFDLLLPVGISFYTFQTLSYSIDIYRGKTKVETNFFRFALYVSFFPQLVAGPIERSNRLLPQLSKSHQFDYNKVVSGLRMVLWGFFKKIMIADRLAILVNEVYNNPADYDGLGVSIATIFFAFQIYCDFSGYSDIAIGIARMLGIDLMTNFRSPYFSKSISEFWSRWHISLSTWFRDYVYIPLGGNKVVKWRWYYNLLITFLISGLWHGSNWTFILWGGIHGVLLILGILFTNLIGNTKSDWIKRKLGLPVVFILVSFSWIYFRANSLNDSQILTSSILSCKWSISEFFDLQNIFNNSSDIYLSFFLIGFLLFVELTEQKGTTIVERVGRYSPLVRWTIYLLVCLAIIYKGVYQNQEFIYFQF
ncbi:MBOAT family O-acyltransferase [Ekhidna sp.]|uniref:MBOAT family O-acyltransferase n=1 Tax=Ekhidna sp. TaxID=2608089 RepID=UPI0032976BD9